MGPSVTSAARADAEPDAAREGTPLRGPANAQATSAACEEGAPPHSARASDRSGRVLDRPWPNVAPLMRGARCAGPQTLEAADTLLCLDRGGASQMPVTSRAPAAAAEDGVRKSKRQCTKTRRPDV